MLLKEQAPCPRGWVLGADMRPMMGRQFTRWGEPVCKEFRGGFSSPMASVPLPLPVFPLKDSVVPGTGAMGAVSHHHLYTQTHTYTHTHTHTLQGSRTCVQGSQRP